MREDIKKTYFSDYLNPSQVLFKIKSKDKIPAIEEVLDVLVKQKHVKDKKIILERILNRERLETTAIGYGIALPHARVDTDGKIAVAVGRSNEGINFEAVDEKKVHLIILIVWNPSIPGLFNHLFAGLAKHIRKTEFINKIFEAKNKSDLYNVLSEIELTFPREDRIINRASLLKKLQDIEIKAKNAKKDKKAKLKKQAEMIRNELDVSLLNRYDRLTARYGFAVAEVIGGTCQGCNINIATGIDAAIEGSNDIYVCENCGRFLVSSKKKKK